MNRAVSLTPAEDAPGLDRALAAQEKLDEALWERDRARRSLDWDLQNIVHCTARIGNTAGNVRKHGVLYHSTVAAAEDRGVARQKFEAALRRFQDSTEKLWEAAQHARRCGVDKDYPALKKLDVPHPSDMKEFWGT